MLYGRLRGVTEVLGLSNCRTKDGLRIGDESKAKTAVLLFVR